MSFKKWEQELVKGEVFIDDQTARLHRLFYDGKDNLWDEEPAQEA